MTDDIPPRDPYWPELVGTVLGVILAAIIIVSAIAHVLGGKL